MKLLHVDSSILGDYSVSRELSAALVAAERAAHPGIEIVRRDLAAEPVGHLTGAHIAAARGGPVDDALRADLALGETVLQEFLDADIVVIGAPMYNFTISSLLKAWIDRLAVAGRTFRYTEAGAEGLAGGKTVIAVSSRGGVYSGDSAIAVLDHHESHLRGVFRLFGITDFTLVRAEGIAMGPDQRARAIAGAKAEIETLVAGAPARAAA